MRSFWPCQSVINKLEPGLLQTFMLSSTGTAAMASVCGVHTMQEIFALRQLSTSIGHAYGVAEARPSTSIGHT